MAKNILVRALDFLAQMGLTVRDDPPKVIDVANRIWSDPVDGITLSAAQVDDRISVVIRNVGTETATFKVNGWLAFYQVEMDAELTPFGRELLKPERQTERLTVTLKPGELLDNELPVVSLFALREGSGYYARVSCTLPSGAKLTSNTIRLKA